MTIVLGIDLATAAARVQAVDVETGVALCELASTLPVTEADGMRTQSPRYAEVVRGLIGGITAQLGPRAARIGALSITGTSGTVVPVDVHGVPVGDAVLYDDPRGGDQLRVLTEAGHGIRPSIALARAAWMHAAAPADRYVFTPDIVAASLAGRLLPSDTSHALKSGIDPVAATWDLAALTAVGLSIERMPELVAPGRPVGEVAGRGALGLPPGVVIVSGMTDGSTGQIATGAVAEGDTVGVLGTTLVLKAVSAHDVVDSASGVYSHVAPDGLFWPGGASNSGAGVLAAGATAGLDPAKHAAAIEAVGPATTVTYPLARPGERFPFWAPRFAGFSVGLDGETRDAADPVQRFRAVFEGVAFVERLGLERLAALEVPQRRHHIAGGAAASALWNRIRATALNRPVLVSLDAGSARGAAALAAAGLGVEGLAAIAERFAGQRVAVDPDPTLADALDERYRVFLAHLIDRSAPASPQ